MTLQPASGLCRCQSDDTTEDTWSVATESASTSRHVLRAFTYLHVQDQDTGVTRMVAGPCSYMLKKSERVTLEPQPMVVVPSAHYCIVESPVRRTDNLVTFDEVGQVLLRHGEREVRLHQPPFPVYPGETLSCDVQPLPVVGANQALRLRALQDTTDSEGTQRRAGDEWLFGPGPGTYMPRPEVTVVGQVDATIVGGNQALRLRALQDTTDSEGTQRKVGDEWLVTKQCAYIPAVREEVVEIFQLERVTLTNSQYCVVCSPVAGEKPQRRVLKGPQIFFLQPEETIQDGTRSLYFLEANQALDLVAREDFTDETVTPAVSRRLGDRWTVRGPTAEFITPIGAEVLRQHSVILLGPNEGVYVQDTVTGSVRAEMGKPYLLTATEHLWSKELTPDSERLLAEYRRETGTGTSQRDKTRVVTYCVPEYRYAVVENHRTAGSRAVYGSNLVPLLPDEQLRVFSVPGGTPVVPNHSQSLTLPHDEQPQYLTDIITVTAKSGEQMALTVHMTWSLYQYRHLLHVAKNAASEEFLRLRSRLVRDAGQDNLKTQHVIGYFRFSDMTFQLSKQLN